ncbi:MAG: 2-oxoglutarate dehydrogenase complex dihydrolipoyllysine-residue succinyltransferase [Proteobacteria bacterium]|nr:2-oxoglutarate dehydrogenase complex dihydrolipoyllysine-residue succinyltransferase [Pseudomonadota bacterium]
MTVEIKVPTLGESVTEATVIQWFKSAGESIATDEMLLELETDKVTLEIPSPAGGRLAEIRADAGDNVEVGAILGLIEEGVAGDASAKKTEPAPAPQSEPDVPAAAAQHSLSPAVRKMVVENDLDPATIPATGKDGRITKGDVLKVIDAAAAPTPEAAPAPAPQPTAAAAKPTPTPTAPRIDNDREERVRMTRLRQRIAERLKEAQNTAAMLTTFNEVDMSNAMALRKEYRDIFEKKHGVRLGFMSLFVKAVITALKEIPAVNAEIDGTDIIYKNYYHIGVAIGSPQGLVVPVLRDADQLSLAGIEQAIGDLAAKARDGKLAIEDLMGGTFTISNGGVYGSLLSTPILNPPQSGILGMHAIKQRPMVVGDGIEARPMMNLALSYDHRIIDGSEAVTFLVRVKECIEDPQRMLLEV